MTQEGGLPSCSPICRSSRVGFRPSWPHERKSLAPAARVRDLDGKRLKALRVTSIEEVRPEDHPKLTPIDRALGVAEKRLFSTTITLDERTIELTGFVGLIAGDWRVLSVLLSP